MRPNPFQHWLSQPVLASSDAVRAAMAADIARFEGVADDQVDALALAVAAACAGGAKEEPMTEQEWLASDDPARMLRALMGGPPGQEGSEVGLDAPGRGFGHGRPSDRKLRLFAVACWRMREAMKDAAGEQVALQAERMADGLPIARVDGHPAPLEANACEAARIMARTSYSPERKPVATLLREIVGNPFRPVPALYPRYQSWAMTLERTEAERLARDAYDNRDFSALPLVADALECAGCEVADVLGHLRAHAPCAPCAPCEGTGFVGGHSGSDGYSEVCVGCNGTGKSDCLVTHVRGCWALDLVLGKE